MTQLISQRVVTSLAELESLKQEMGHFLSLSGPALAHFENIKDTLTHLLHCLTGQAHEDEGKGWN